MKKKRKGSKFEKSLDSGRFWFDPLDGNLETKWGKYCVEAKETEKKGYRISKQLLDKIWVDSLDCNKLPLLMIKLPADDNFDYLLTVQIAKIKKRNK